MEVFVKVIREDSEQRSIAIAATAFLTFVALDDR